MIGLGTLKKFNPFIGISDWVKATEIGYSVIREFAEYTEVVCPAPKAMRDTVADFVFNHSPAEDILWYVKAGNMIFIDNQHPEFHIWSEAVDATDEIVEALEENTEIDFLFSSEKVASYAIQLLGNEEIEISVRSWREKTSDGYRYFFSKVEKKKKNNRKKTK